MLPQKRHSGVQLVLCNGICPAQNDGRGGFYLIIEKFAEVFHKYLTLCGVHYGDGITKLHILQFHSLHCGNHIRQLAHAGRLDEHPVGVILLDNLCQRLAKIADQRAADAAGVHFRDLNPGFLQKAAVNADLTKFIFNEHQLLPLIALGNELFNQRCFACAEKTGVNINFCHKKCTFYFENYPYYTTQLQKSKRT